MVVYCTNCGTKLEDDDDFCTNCGTKVEKPKRKRRGLFGKLKHEMELINDEDINESKKEAKRIMGGVTLNNNFQNRLDINGLSKADGTLIKSRINGEIYSRKIKKNDIENRVNELLIEKKLELEEKYEEFKFIDEFFELEETKSKITDGNITNTKIIAIKSDLKNKVRFEEPKMSKEEIKKYACSELEKEELVIKGNELVNNRLEYVNNKIKESNPNITLTSFEKEHITSRRLDGTFSQNKIELNKIANSIIKEHEKIGKYDFAGQLIEEGGFTNAVDVMDLKKRARKDSDYLSNVFIKIFENNIKIVGSEIVPVYIHLSMTPKYKGVVGKDRTIFFNDIIGIGYSGEEIHLNLSNNEKLILKGKKSTELNEHNIESFYNSLNHTWEKFKNNENEKTIQNIEKNEISVADELMKYGELYEKGLLTEEEFNAAKKKLLGL